MKEIFMIIFIILIIVFGSIYTCNYLNRTSQPILDNLKDLKNNIGDSEVSKTKLIIIAEDIIKKWNNIKEEWSNIVLHQEIDSIETSLIKLKTKIEIGKQDEALEELETAVFLVEHIKEKELVSLKNIL